MARQEFEDVADRLSSSHLTDDDLLWVDENPDLAAVMLDPSLTEFTTETVPAPSILATTTPGETTALKCQNYTQTGTYRAAAGNTLYRYRTFATFCYKTGAPSVSTYYGYFDSLNPLYYVVNANLTKQNFVNSLGARQVQTQGHVQFCVTSSYCAFSFYPWNQIQAFSSGSFRAKSWQ